MNTGTMACEHRTYTTKEGDNIVKLASMSPSLKQALGSPPHLSMLFMLLLRTLHRPSQAQSNTQGHMSAHMLLEEEE